MNKRGLRWGLAAVVVAGLMVALSGVSARAEDEKTIGGFPASWFYRGDRAKLDELLGKPAPELNLSEGVGTLPTADQMKDKILIVDIWATWCAPCIASIPHNNEMVKKYKDKPVMLVAVCSSSKGQEDLENVAKDRGIEYPVSKDPGGKIAEAWHVQFFPTYAVVDQKGVLRAIGLTPGSVEKVVEKLLEEGAAAEKK